MTLITFHNLHTAKRDGRLAAWLLEMTPVERVEAAEVCAANSTRLSVSQWLDVFGELMAAERVRVRAAVEAAAERDALVECLDELIVEGDDLHQTRADLARNDVLGGVHYERHAGYVTVQRPGREAHRVDRNGCDCKDHQFRGWCRHAALRVALVRLHQRQARVEDVEVKERRRAAA